MSSRNEEPEYPTEEYPTEDVAQQQEQPPQQQDDEYPQEEEYPQEDEGNRNAGEFDDEEHLDHDDASANAEDRYEQRVAAANAVWFSGFFSGASYVPKPKRVKTSELDESEQEEILEEKSYEVPRGYKYLPENLPPILQQKPTGSLHTALIVFIVCSLFSFIFLLVSACPVPWFKGKDVTVNSRSYKGVKWTLYYQDGGDIARVSLRELRTCPIQKQFFQTIAASVIMATVFALISTILAIVRLTGGKVGYGWIMIFSFFAFFWGLAGNAMSISQFHLSRCGLPRYPEVARLDAGFAVSLIGWVFMLVALLVLFIATKVNVGPALKNVRVMDTWFLVLTFVALLMLVVANATTIWKRHFGDEKVRVVRVTYWHTELIMGDGTNIIYGRAAYRCSAYNKRIKASISFLILGSVSTFGAALMGIGAFNSRGLRIGACVMSIISLVFLFVSWVTSVAIFYRTLCKRSVANSVYADYPGVPSGIVDGYTKFDGYGLAEGVALVIVGWILILFATIANIAVPWPTDKVY